MTPHDVNDNIPVMDTATLDRMIDRALTHAQAPKPNIMRFPQRLKAMSGLALAAAVAGILILTMPAPLPLSTDADFSDLTDIMLYDTLDQLS